MTRPVLLLDIGAGDLPATTPATPTASSWFPVPYTAAPLPAPGNTSGTPLANSVLLQWDAVAGADGYTIERGPTAAGPWTYVTTVGAPTTRYTYSDGTSTAWYFRITPVVRGINGNPSQVQAAPVSPAPLQALIDLQMEHDQEVEDRVAGDLAEASARANGLAAEAQARVDAIAAEHTQWSTAITTEQTQRSTADNLLAQSISTLAAGTGEQFDSRKVWYFDADLESWTGNGAPTVSGGYMRPANHATDPYVASPTGTAVVGDSYRYVKAKIRRTGNPAWVGELRWRRTTDAAGAWQGPFTIPAPSFQADGDATIDFKDIPWSATIDQIRLDLTSVQDASNYIQIDWVAIGRATPGASIAALQEEASARISGDASEAAQRTTLGAQMRGGYTGTDINAVTSGLLYAERVARADADSAQAASILAIRASLSGGGNLLVNPSFDVDLEGWSYGWNPAGFDAIGRNLAAPDWKPAGANTIGHAKAGITSDVNHSFIHGKPVPVKPLTRYIYAALVAAHRCDNGAVVVERGKLPDGSVDAASNLGEPKNIAAAPSGGQNLNDWRLSVIVFTTSANTYYVQAGLWTRTIAGQSNPFSWMCRPMLEEASAEQTGPSPWSDSSAGLDTKYASVTESFDARVGLVEGGVNEYKASHTIALDVNGNISGTRSENDGTTSSFSILATVFRVISNLSGMGMEWQNGYLRMWKGSAQLLLGHTFGVNGDLVFWYGPNIGAAACTKANGTIWFDTSGGAYFGGTLSAGVLKNGAQSSQVSGTASVESGNFGTNGNAKTVVASLSYTNGGLTSSAPWGGGSNGVPQTTSATLTIQRSLNGGAWTNVASTTVTGQRMWTLEGGDYVSNVGCSGSVTYTDNTAGVGPFNYRAILSSPANWPWTIGSSQGTQRLSILSTEQ